MRKISAFLAPVFESVRHLTPIIVVVTFFQLIVLRQPLPDLVGVLTGALLVVLGLTLFLRGLDLGLFPIGESLAHGFARKGSVWWLVFFAFALGFGTTIAEPALVAVATEAAVVVAEDGVIENTDSARAAYALGLRITVGLAVGVAIVVGVLRIIHGWPIQ
ncbi:MAG: DUF1538 domain-containing protein, partial [Proteobacteria bacterium]